MLHYTGVHIDMLLELGTLQLLRYLEHAHDFQQAGEYVRVSTLVNLSLIVLHFQTVQVLIFRYLHALLQIEGTKLGFFS